MSCLACTCRTGMALVLVLVVVALLSLAGLTFSELMLVERRAALTAVELAQARAAADSGIELARWFLAQEAETQHQAGGWYDNPRQFQGIALGEDSSRYGAARFTIVAPRADDHGWSGVRFGLEDESARLNLNALLAAEKASSGAGRKLLLALPGMTEQIADAILDWLDADDRPREFGAEVDYYSALEPPYAPKNGPLDTIEELLLVRGVTPGLLFGADINRNGCRDANEPDPVALGGVLGGNGEMDRGWAACLTLHSCELNLRRDGRRRVNLNQDDMQKLYDELLEALGNEYWATFIVAFRQNGPYTGTKTGELAVGKKLDLTKKGDTKLTTVLDLIGTRVQVTFIGDRNPTVLESPFPNVPVAMNAFLPILMDNLTVNPEQVIVGRININQAPRVVLAGIPGMRAEVVDAILSQRTLDSAQAAATRRHETWILAEGIVSLEEMKALMPFVTGGGCVFRAHVVGYFERGGPAARVEAILDASQQPPQLRFWRDLSHLGRGYPLELLGTTAETFAK